MKNPLESFEKGWIQKEIGCIGVMRIHAKRPIEPNFHQGITV